MIADGLHASAIPMWSTAAFGAQPGTSATEISALGEHLGHCHRSHGRLFGLGSALQSLHCFVASRFMTTVLLAGLLIGAGCLFKG